ncbi:MAG TPA: DUF2199 domain-containing protein [Stellaceae bacterium]|nr:DUF2199 domain-containing protein [Stellaceae bacterium]
MDHAWTCRCCGKSFSTLPLDFACAPPDHWNGLSAEERSKRGKIDSDRCRIDDDFFIRGCLELPIIGAEDKFVWGVWVSVSQASFDRILDLWDATNRASEPAKFGWLCNAIPGYPTTLGLKTNLHLRSDGVRPAIVLEPTDHPLAVEQRHGVTLERIEEIVAGLSLRH